jgi:hypothetical protein
MSASTRRRPLQSITARLSRDEKVQFACLANARGVSESALALAAIRTVIARVAVSPTAAVKPRDPSTDRITIRLRPGDKTDLQWRASQRGMKTSAYLAALARSHLRLQPPLARNELQALKQSVALLARMGTTFVEASRKPSGTYAHEDLRRLLEQLARAIAALEQRTEGLARTAQISWESHCD